jgi:hypothetical protein
MSRVFESPDDPPGPARIIDLYCGYMISQTLFAAVESGLFAAAGPEPATPAELADRCGIPERSARATADLLADAGLLVRDGAAFRTVSTRSVVPRSPPLAASMPPLCQR